MNLKTKIEKLLGVAPRPGRTVLIDYPDYRGVGPLGPGIPFPPGSVVDPEHPPCLYAGIDPRKEPGAGGQTVATCDG